jgi:hypothetical protein
LGLAAFENYLLALGNATSILVVLAFFLQERLKSMAGREILQRVSSPAQVFKKTSLAWRQDIP